MLLYMEQHAVTGRPGKHSEFIRAISNQRNSMVPPCEDHRCPDESIRAKRSHMEPPPDQESTVKFAMESSNPTPLETMSPMGSSRAQ